MTSIWAIGLNFKNAPVEYREVLACNKEDLKNLLPLLRTINGVEEVCVLSTCNRVEIYGLFESERAVKELIDTFLDFKGANKSISKYFFTLKDKKAVFHIFKVASSLDSMVVGEPQIVHQFKEAFFLAKEIGTSGKILNRLFEKALKASKRVRTETKIARNAVSVSYVSVELAKRIFGDLRKARVLLVGAGEMGELAANYLKRIGANLLITNRTYERAMKLAQKLEGSALRFEDMEDYISDMDIIIVSTGAQNYVITEKLIRKAMKKRDYKPMFIIDISVPRNVEPSVGKIDEVFLYNIDDLREIVEMNMKDRLKEASKGEILLWDEVKKFFEWLESLKVEPLVLELKRRLAPVEKKEPYVRKIVHRAIKEMKRNPDIAGTIYKILVEEVEDVNGRKELSYVHSGVNGAGG